MFTDSIPQHLTGNPLLDLALYNRGVTSLEDVEYGLSKLIPVSTLTHSDVLAARLLDEIKTNKRIVIIGDYDCDGATSTAVMIRMLKSLEANVAWLIPDREIHGYGLSPKIVQHAFDGWVTGDVKSLPEMERQIKESAYAIARSESFDMDDLFKNNEEYIIDTALPAFQSNEKPDLILTVDNGIANFEGVELANKLGLEVLITDHHLAGKTLPNASVIVNPNEPNNQFTSKALCGVGVAWYVCLMLAKLAKADKEKVFKPLDPISLLPLVAIGTVADVVALDRNNQIIVSRGLDMLRKNPVTFLGINALLAKLNIQSQNLSTMDIGFYMAPCLNAAGRIKHMGVGVMNLITDSWDIASITASQLYELNQRRKAITKNVMDESVQQLVSDTIAGAKTDDYVIVCAPNEEQSWHEGVIGIAAGKIKEQLNRPTIVFSYIEEKQLYKGSCRSIPSLHFKDLLDAVNLADPTLMANYGGHAMAAGLSVHADKLERFKEIINQEAVKRLSSDDFIKYKYTDGCVHSSLFTVDNAFKLSLHPWGQNNPAPIFHNEFTVLKESRMGSENQHLRLTVQCNGKTFTAIKFNCPDWEPKETFRSTFQLSINRWQGRESVKLMLLDTFDNVEELTPFEDLMLGKMFASKATKSTKNKNTPSVESNTDGDSTMSKPAYLVVENSLAEW